MTPSVSPVVPVIVTITGPSASGKTVLSALLHEAGLRTLVSTTTRAPRRGEVDGADYHFITKDEFLARKDAGRFIESISYNDTLYGVSADEAEAAFQAGQSAVLVAEPHGVAQIAQYAHRHGWSVLRVFVDNPDEILLGRLLNRLAQDVLALERADNDLTPYALTARRLASLVQQQAAHGPDVVAAALRRVLTEFLTGLSAGRDLPDDVEPRLDAAVKRLTSFGFEQANWVQPARSGEVPYEIITERFDSSVQDSMVHDILLRVAIMQDPSLQDPGTNDATASAERPRPPRP